MWNDSLFSVETRWMLAVLRGEQPPAIVTLDNRRFFEQCVRHRLVNVLCQNYQAALTCLPRELRRALAEENAKNALRQLQNIAATERVLDDFRALGLPALVIKGAPLAQLLYSDPGARMSRDIDLLVMASHYDAACCRLEKLGYALKTLPTATHSVWRDAEGAVVELHSRLSIFGLGRDWLRSEKPERRQKVDVAGRDYCLPHANEYFVYLCWHGASHGWYRLLWLLDIARLLERNMVDVDEALRIARRYGLTTVCFQALLLAQRLLGAEIPEKAQSAKAQRLAQQACELALCSERPYDECFDYTRQPLRELRYQLAVQGRLRACAQFLLQPTVEDRRQLALAPNREWLYAVLRPLLLLTRVVRKALQRMPTNGK